MVYYIFQTFENIVATFVCSASNGHRENCSIETPWHNADIQNPIMVSLCSAANVPEKLCYFQTILSMTMKNRNKSKIIPIVQVC